MDTHVAGEVFRVFVHSPIGLKNHESLKSLYHSLLKGDFQQERDLLLNEPRGHSGINGCIVVSSDVADFGLIVMDHAGSDRFTYSSLVATITALLEAGHMSLKESNLYKVETIHGVFSVNATYENEEVTNVRVNQIGCEVVEISEDYHIVEFGHSGTYLIMNKPNSIPDIEVDHLSHIIKWGMETTKAMQALYQFDGLIMVDPEGSQQNNVRSITFKNDGTIIRSPGMESTAALFTIMRSPVEPGTEFSNTSIFGSCFTACANSGELNGFSIDTQGFVTGYHQFIYDREDPLKNGFLIK